MQRLFTVCALVAFACAMACAETWTGKLVDAVCVDQHQKNEACVPTASTASFAIQASGKMLKLDAEGNRKAIEALKQSNNSADRAADPNAPYTQVTATVTGSLNGDEIKVDAIAIR